jgi:ubiquinone/menaquinone biosynthesis C-methylase UbiE
MDAQTQHGVLIERSLDEQARQLFVKDFRSHLASQVVGGVPVAYSQVELPKFIAAKGRPPKDKDEIRQFMLTNPYYQFWSGLQRTSQEMMWDSVIDSVERQAPALNAKAKTLTAKAKKAAKLGSLRLNPSLEIPRYHTAVDIHIQPGGYHNEFADDDITAGAIYDRGVHIYLMGGMGPENDSLGRISSNWFRTEHPELKPARILDMGCTTGNSTLPWARMFPKAEVHAIDVAAPVLRYAHARAVSLGVPVHYSQQNAEHTDFEDESFDVIVSHIMLHETSNKALPNVLAESRRLLKPGGIMIHLEIPRPDDMFEKFMFDWEAYNNNEPFSMGCRESDLIGLAKSAGFDPDKVTFAQADAGLGSGQRNYSATGFLFPMLKAEKSAPVSTQRLRKAA